MALTDEEIQDQLNRILAHEKFSAAPRRSKFLSYVVEQTLSGKKDQLKGYSIGVDVFDRPDDFDPQIDTIVRVQAARLRETLSMYYLTSGADDPVLIEVKKGSYVPHFSRQNSGLTIEQDTTQTSSNEPSIETENKVSVSPPRNISSTLVRNRIAMGLLCCAALLYVLFNTLRGVDVSASTFEKAAILPSGPSVSVRQFETLSSTSPENIRMMEIGFQHELVGKLSRFKDLRVITDSNLNDPNRSEVNAADSTDYFLTGSIQTESNVFRLTSSLVQRESGEVIWSKTYDETLDGADTLLKIQSSIASDVASTLGQPYGPVNKSFTKELETFKKQDVGHYFCLMRFYEYTAQKSETLHKQVRDCLETSVDENPELSSTWAALSWMYGDESRNGFNPVKTAEPPHQRALSAAQKATEADGRNAMAYQYLAIAHFTLGNDLEFKKAAQIALQLNPNDAEVLADVGSHLIQLDDSGTGHLMVEKAIVLNPSHPYWYHGSLTMYYYMQGDTEQALFNAREYSQDGSLLSQALLVASLMEDDQVELAKENYKTLISNYPQFKDNFETIIQTWRLPEGMDEKVLENLKVARG